MNPEPPKFTMTRFELVAPEVTNAGERSGYPERIAAMLDRKGLGWKATREQTGSWHGKREPVVTFEILTIGHEPAVLLGWARKEMPDQEAIQLTDCGKVTVYEG